MDKLSVILVTLGSFVLGALLGSVVQTNSEIKSQDPCQQIHGLKTIDIRDYKPKYNRELKQVVSTCGDKNAPNK